MDRRLLGWMLSIAHFFIMVLGLVIVFAAGWMVIEVARQVTGPSPLRREHVAWIPFAVAVVLLLAWYLSLLFFPLRMIRRAMREGMEGKFEEASARLRRLRDREVVLRLIGVPGPVWSQARVGEAYVYHLHGLGEEALAGALELARDWRPSVSRNASVIAAAAAANLGELAAFESLAPHLRKAERNLSRAYAHSLLGAEGIAWALQLRLEEAARRAGMLIAADPRTQFRMGRVLRAQVRAIRGDLDGADEDYAAVLASPSLAAKTTEAIFVRQTIDVGRADLRRMRGDFAGAAEIAMAINAEGPRHRMSRVFGASFPGLSAAHRGDAASARAALGVLDRLDVAWQFDPLLRAQVGLEAAQILLAMGDAAGALQRLGPAIASPLAVLRLGGLHEQGLAKAALGDAAGARESFGWCAALGPGTRLGKMAAERVT